MNNKYAVCMASYHTYIVCLQGITIKCANDCRVYLQGIVEDKREYNQFIAVKSVNNTT
jgi:hypothetical protein